MQILTANEAKNYAGGFKLTIGVGVAIGAIISFALGFVNAFFSPTCSR